MSFACSKFASYIKWQCTSGTLLLTILVLLTVLTVSSFPSKGGHECPNCGEQYVKIINASTGKCFQCWRCPKCNDGTGSSVVCPSTVTVGTKIHCVQCLRGVNFSDRSGTDQCQPCGICSGKHEHVLHECTPESDVKCDCDNGFYRNKTTNECLPCGSCSGCSNDDEISLKCKEDESGQYPKPTDSASLPTVVHSEDGSVAETHSTVLATSSALVTSSNSHEVSATPSLLPSPTIVKAPASSKTQLQPIRATSMSILDNGKHDVLPTVQVQVINHYVYKDHTHETSNKSTDIIITVTMSIVCVLLLIGVLYLCHKLKKSRTRRLNDDPRNQVRFSELNQGASVENEQGNIELSEESNSCESSNGGVILHERNDSEGLSSALKDLTDTCSQTVDSAHQDGRAIASGQSELTSAEVVTCIPSSLEDEQTKDTTQGQPPSDFPEDAHQDDSATASLAEEIVHCNNLDSPNKTIPYANTSTNVNVFLTFNDPSQIQRGIGTVSPFADFASTSCGDNLVIPASSTGMPMALNQGTICDLSSVAAPAVQSSEGNRGYSTHITLVPLCVIQSICMLLDLERDLDGKDYRMLGGELGLTPLMIHSLKQQCVMSNTCKSPSSVLLLQVFSAMPNSGTLEHLIPILTKMGRHDVIQVIDEWVGSQNCTQVAQVN